MSAAQRFGTNFIPHLGSRGFKRRASTFWLALAVSNFLCEHAELIRPRLRIAEQLGDRVKEPERHP